MMHYYRLSGGGNDFLALVEPSVEPDSDEIRDLCRRGLSAGADGFFILERRPKAVGMEYFNADGHPADLCLNGTRCAVRLAHHMRWDDDPLKIETGAGTFSGRLVDHGSVALDLPRPDSPVGHALAAKDETYSGWRVKVGVPHFVLPWNETLSTAPVSEIGPRLRRHQDWGQEGSNIDFVRFVDPHHFEIRTFERGVEAETLACGTGVMASTAAGLATGALELPVRALTLGGFELEVDHGTDEEANLWSLTGDARLVAEGTLHPGARTLPPPPTWTP